MGIDELVGFLEIREAQRFTVPAELLEGQIFAQLKSQGHISEQDGLRQWSGPVEVCSGFGSAFACSDPLLVVPDRSWQRAGDGADRFSSGFREDRVVQDVTLVPDN